MHLLLDTYGPNTMATIMQMALYIYFYEKFNFDLYINEVSSWRSNEQYANIALHMVAWGRTSGKLLPDPVLTHVCHDIRHH